MHQLKYFLFGVVFLLAACSKTPQGENQSAQQQPTQPPAQQQPAQEPAPAAEAPAAAQPQPQASQSATHQQPPHKAGQRAAAPAKHPPGASEPSAPISRSDEQPAGGASANVVPPTRGSDVPPAAVAPEPPRPRLAVIPSGTKLNVRLTEPVGTDTNKSGDKFEATLDEDLVADGRVIAPRGSVVTGKVVNADQGGRVEGVAGLSLTLTEIQTKTASYPIRTNTLTFSAESTKKKDATKIGAGAGIGAVIGAIAGGGKGAAIGAAVGGGAGTGAVLATRGKAVKFPSEHQFEFSLRNDLQVKLQ